MPQAPAAIWLPAGPVCLDRYRTLVDCDRSSGRRSFGRSRSELRTLWHPSAGWNVGVAAAPAMDLVECGNANELSARIPRLRRGSVAARRQQDRLTIRGRMRKRFAGWSTAMLFGSDPDMGQFERSIVLTDAIDEHRIETTYRDAVLRIRVPKRD